MPRSVNTKHTLLLSFKPASRQYCLRRLTGQHCYAPLITGALVQEFECLDGPKATTLLRSTGKEHHEQLQKALWYDGPQQPYHTLSKSDGKTSDVSDDASRVPFRALDSTKTLRTWTSLHELRL